MRKWDETTAVSRHAFLPHFAAFLHAGGQFERLAATCPVRYTSPNAPPIREVLATAVAGIVLGMTRYRHFGQLRCDEVAAAAFGVRTLRSCDAVRRFVREAAKDPAAGLAWAWDALFRSVAPLPPHDYALDLDPTVKPLYGHQDGAELGYNPHKPGRPSHCYHTMVVAMLRMAVAVVVHPGNETSGTHSEPMLASFLRSVPPAMRPRLVRGDVGFGNEAVVLACEQAGEPHLFKVRRSQGIRALFESAGEWRDAGEGWESFETRARAARPFRRCAGAAAAMGMVCAGDGPDGRAADGRRALPGARRRRERLRRAQEPVGLVRLHGAGPDGLGDHGRAGGDGGQLVERLRPARRGRRAPRGDHVQAAAAADGRQADAPRGADVEFSLSARIGFPTYDAALDCGRALRANETDIRSELGSLPGVLDAAVLAAVHELPAAEPDPLEITAESAWTDAGLATMIRLRNASDRPVAGTLAAFAPEDAVLDAAGGDPSGTFDLAPGETFARTVLWRGTADPATALFAAAPRRALRDGVPAVIAGLRIDGSFRTRVVEAPFRDGGAAFLPDRFEVPAGTRAVTLRARFGAAEEAVEVPLPERSDEVFRLPVFRARSAAGAPDGARNAAAELVGHRPATAIPGEIVIDGDLSEWAGRRFVPLGLPCQARTSRGVSDPRAALSDLFPGLSFFAGREALHMAMRAAGAAPGDGLTLFLDPRAPEAFGTAGSYVWAGIGLKEDGVVEVSRGETSPPGPGTVGRWRRTPDGTLEAEWSIPWEWAGLDAFPASGRLGLSVIYRQGRPPYARLSWVESYFEWTPLHYGELRLVPDAAAESGDALPWLLRVEP